jgi:hypothetical protein
MLLATDPLSLNIARLNACSESYAGRWLTTMLSNPSLALNDTAMRLGCTQRLGINPFFYDADGPVVLCKHYKSGIEACRTVDLRKSPYHCLHCLFNCQTGRNTEHNRVLHQMIDMARTCNSTHAEALPKGFHGVDKDGKKSDKSQPDGLIYMLDGNLLFDVRGIDITSPAYIKLNQHDPNKAYQQACADKINKYQKTAERTRCNFSPFVFNVHGGLTESAVRLIRKITSLKRGMPPGVSRSQLNNDKISEMVVTIMRSNADIILAAHSGAR